MTDLERFFWGIFFMLVLAFFAFSIIYYSANEKKINQLMDNFFHKS